MDSTQPDMPGGLPAHVMQQLQQASQIVSQAGQAPNQAISRGGHHGGAHRGINRGQSNSTSHSQASRQANISHTSQDSQAYQQPGYRQRNALQRAYQSPPAGVNQMSYQQNVGPPQPGSEDDFPALGSTRSTKPSRPSSHAPSQPLGVQSVNHAQAQDFQQRARAGFYRGHNSFPHQHLHGSFQQHRFEQQPQYRVQQFQADDFSRPPPQHQGVYNPMAVSVANQRHAPRKRVMLQNEYLEAVAVAALENQMPVEEQQEKEAMRQTLEHIMHGVIDEYGRTRLTIAAAKVKLKCYGSLASGFAVTGSDMDLLVTFPREGERVGDLEEDIKRLFERALLDAGFGARLLTQTRVPILRVCETPTPEILDGLRRYRAKWEQDEQDAADLKNDNFDSYRLPVVTREQIEAGSDIFAELGDEPGETPLPPSPGRELPHLEYTKDCGIQCDINFSNYVALHNTRLLRTYCLHDERVRRMGLIVKAWAKARKINTPYHGTLSSYGYILMLLHFLMNVASPPIVPNLQAMARDQDAWANRKEFETVDGFDVRFVSNPEQVAAVMEGWPRNQEPLGALLRGFFWYYSDHGGFHWTNDVISIRTLGGTLTKRSKGWTEAKWTGAKNTIRNRYLLCIEDPFEIEHNIARTVCHSGIVAIRDEFRRARKIIERVEQVRGIGWQWLEDNGEPGQEFMAVAEHRGDLLRKDYDFHKLKRLRAEAEAIERALKEANALVDQEERDADDGSKQDGTSSQHYSQKGAPFKDEEESRKLTQSVGHQQENSPLQRGRLRRLKSDSDDEQDEAGIKSNCEDSASRNEITEKKGLSASICITSNDPDDQDELEPNCFYSNHALPRTVDISGKPLPWDLDTQEGRWLHWRDGKVRDGTFTGILSPGLRMLNEQCPFDPVRPLPVARSHHGKLDLIRPPFPMSKPAKEESLRLEKVLSHNDEPASLPDPPMKAIGWDMSVSDCRWLSKRDEWMKAGTFILPSDPHVRNLNNEFPYLRQTPPTEQVRRNQVLRQRHTRWLRGEISQLEKDTLYESKINTLDRTHAGPAKDVGWDISLADGRWLRNRDELVRKGQFRRTHYQPRTLRLHDDFPYISNVTPVGQMKRNLELKLWGIERLIAEIPEDVRETLDNDMHQDLDSVDPDPTEAVPRGPEKLQSNEPSVANDDSVDSTMEVVQNEENEARWKVLNRTGKWLDDRDAAIQAGTWEPPGMLQSWQERTDRMFLLSPDPSREEQTERNKALRYWGSNGVPSDSTTVAPPVAKRRGRGARKCGHRLEDASGEQLVSFSEEDQKSEREMVDQPWMKIHWERSTWNGKWLRWRDRQIKQGTWKGTINSRFRRLDKMFPYLESPSLQEQADRNVQLLAMRNDHEPTRSHPPRNRSRTATEKKPATRSPLFKPESSAATDLYFQKAQEGSGSDKGTLLSKMTWNDSLLGSWFKWRDNKIRNGTWKDIKDNKFLCWLDLTLPYISQPTPDQQTHLNEQLEAITAKNPQLKTFEGLQHTRGNGRPMAKDMIHLLSLVERKTISRRRIAPSIHTKPPHDSWGKASDQDFVRSQRLHYFASQSGTTTGQRSENQNPHNTQGLTGEAGMSPSLMQSSKTTKTTASLTTSQSITPFVNYNLSKTNLDGTARALVPQTLHEGSVDDRPRDEDPAILPIPSTLSFSFDERQLRDLSIIQQGGNGCARFGEEWNVETEGQWGGGGWMGHKSTSKEEQQADAEADGKWEGKGDVEGLLGELPCL